MKRLKIILALTLICTAFLLSDCKKTKNDILNPAGNCNTLSTKFSDAFSAYLSDPSVANCQAYVQTLKDYVNGCAALTQAEKDTYNASIDATDCSQ
jgi:hypothetical protein